MQNKIQENKTIIINAVARYLRKINHGNISWEDKEDLIQEAWLLLPRVVKEFNQKDDSRFAAFAVERLAWRLLDRARNIGWAPRSVPAKERRSQVPYSRVGEDEGDSYETTLYDHGIYDKYKTPLDNYIDQDAYDGLVRKLESSLPVNYQKAFHLYFVDKLNMAEAAKTIGVTESRICQQIGIAKRILKRDYPDYAKLFAL